jgi:hypothetical protein
MVYGLAGKFDGFRGLSRGRDVKQTIHLHLVLRLRMKGDIPQLPHTSLWCGALEILDSVSQNAHCLRYKDQKVNAVG